MLQFIVIIITIISVIWFCKPLRFYLCSFWFTQLYNYPTLAKWLDIRYEKDSDWITNRKESRVYLPGITAWLLKLFIGMDFILDENVRKEFERIQFNHVKEFKMRNYFNELDNQIINLYEFEDFLSKSMIIETNRVFKILNDEYCDLFVTYSKALRTMMSALTFSIWEGIKATIINIPNIILMSMILRTCPKHKRILLLAPQLALIHNFTKMIVSKNGDMSDLQPHDFLEPISKLFVAETINPSVSKQLIFVSCEHDKRNNTSNTTFGPHGLQCPGAQYTIKFIKDVMKFLQIIQIKVNGTPKYKGERFNSIINKDEVTLSFKF